MSYVACPFCEKSFRPKIEWPGDGDEHECACEHCGKMLSVVSEVRIEFTAFCKDSEHDLETRSYGSATWEECNRCGETMNIRERKAAQ